MKVSSRTMWAVMAVAAGAGLAAMYWPATRIRVARDWRHGDADNDLVDEASADSFPASDPPSFSAPSGGAQADDIPPASRV
jgi:hypothetical protein